MALQESSEHEEGPETFPAKNHGVPRGRRVRGLVELQTRLPEYQGLVSYRAYRLKDTEAVIDENDTGRCSTTKREVVKFPKWAKRTVETV
jgi:hypothetical protein